MMNLNHEEKILNKTQCYYYKNLMEKVIGDLISTNQRTIFISKKINLQQEYIEIDNNNIQIVVPFNSFFFIPDGLMVQLKTGVQYKFKVIERDKLINLYK